MSSPISEINTILIHFAGQASLDLEEMRKHLYTRGILTKDYPEQGLMLLYHKYDVPCSTSLQRATRSLVIDRKTLNIVAYTCPTPLVNKEGMDYLLAHTKDNQVITECWEGTMLSLFHCNDTWHLSTRRCLDASESQFKSSSQSHRSMFESIIKQSTFKDFDDFCSSLDKTLSYYFVLVHHQNKHIIDYTSTLGSNYAKLVVAFVRDANMNEVAIPPFFNSEQFIVPQVLSNYNLNQDITSEPTSEGVVVRINGQCIKLEHANYRFYSSMGSDRNILRGLLHLYQQGRLVEYLSKNPQHKQIGSFDIVGVIDATLKALTSELFELFKTLWSIKSGKIINESLYDLLPREYKDIMFAIRGLYFRKKADFIQSKKQDVDVKTNYTTITDVYNLLKSQSTEVIVALLRMNRLMNNWTLTNEKLKDYQTCSSHISSIQHKLRNLFLSKLFPEITKTDIPQIN